MGAEMVLPPLEQVLVHVPPPLVLCWMATLRVNESSSALWNATAAVGAATVNVELVALSPKLAPEVLAVRWSFACMQRPIPPFTMPPMSNRCAVGGMVMRMSSMVEPGAKSARSGAMRASALSSMNWMPSGDRRTCVAFGMRSETGKPPGMGRIAQPSQSHAQSHAPQLSQSARQSSKQPSRQPERSKPSQPAKRPNDTKKIRRTSRSIVISTIQSRGG
jgi:hypothetical protein